MTTTSASYPRVTSGAGDFQINVMAQPRPHTPQTVYPANGEQHAATSFTLRWTSGIDTERSYWPATYDIYAHGPGAPELLEFSNIACNPDSSGNCTAYVPDVLSSAYIEWRIVAKLRVDNYFGNPYFATNTPVFTFTTMTDPNRATPSTGTTRRT